jgi:hypothetical protein
MGEISRKEFVTGFAECDTIPKITNQIKTWGGLLTRKSDEFKRFYRWVFDFVKETEERKTLDKVSEIQSIRALCLPLFACPLLVICCSSLCLSSACPLLFL